MHLLVVSMLVGRFACFHGISLERSRFRKISGSRNSEDVGIAHGPPRSL